MSSRKTLGAGVAALGIAIALAGCGAGRGGPGPGAVDNGPAVSPVAAAGDAAGDPYASDAEASPTESVEASAQDAVDDGYGAQDEPAAAASTTAAAKAPAPAAATVRSARQLVSTNIPRMGNVVTDEHGWVLYRFDKDKPSPPASACAGACATTWPPVVVESKPKVKGVDAAKVGLLKRADGTWQVTLAGWPLYYYAKDAKPGQWKGQGVGGTWFAVTKDGKKNLTCLPNGSTAVAAAQKKAVEATTAGELVGLRHPNLGDVVTDEKGRVLYRFDKDTPRPPASNCSGACATAWPPVLVQGMPKVKGVDPGLVGAIKRADGTWQATLAGWPLYYFAKDTTPGQWKGQGSGGAWFVVKPDGTRNTNCIPAENMAAVREALAKAQGNARTADGQATVQYAGQGYGGSGNGGY